jgi:hypothetical protein
MGVITQRHQQTYDRNMGQQNEEQLPIRGYRLLPGQVLDTDKVGHVIFPQSEKEVGGQTKY